MLNRHDVIATIAVSNLGRAKEFYEGTLGLKLVDKQGSEALAFEAGSTRVLVYRSQFAGTNKATAATWRVGGDVEEITRVLKSRGVPFEHYELPGMTLKGDVHVAGDFKVAWFKDPDGNILSLVSG